MDHSQDLAPEACQMVANALDLPCPIHVDATDDELNWYVRTVADALRALEPWRTTVTDQLETVYLVQSLLHLHTVHEFSVEEDEGDPTLHVVVSRLRQSVDAAVAKTARSLFERLCSEQ